MEVLYLDKYTKSSLNKFKEEVANQLGINLKPGDNGNLSARDAGRIGGEMVRRMVKAYQERLK
ncbi:MAG: alpha/beta-type small acid-soluble spore protein [Clostridiales bacterium]|nr:alpha/beta-type small acid-soluble spore protein [Clostridiales bacterium]